MTKKTRRKFSEEVKSKAVADYLSGTKSANQIAQELGVEVHVIYNWRASSDEKIVINAFQDFNPKIFQQ